MSQIPLWQRRQQRQAKVNQVSTEPMTVRLAPPEGYALRPEHPHRQPQLTPHLLRAPVLCLYLGSWKEPRAAACCGR